MSSWKNRRGRWEPTEVKDLVNTEDVTINRWRWLFTTGFFTTHPS